MRSYFYCSHSCALFFTFAAFRGGAVFIVVCLFVGYQNDSKSFGWIFVNFGKYLDYKPAKSWYNFKKLKLELGWGYG